MGLLFIKSYLPLHCENRIARWRGNRTRVELWVMGIAMMAQNAMFVDILLAIVSDSGHFMVRIFE